MAIIGVPNPNDGDDADRARFIERMSTQVSHVLDDPGAVWTENGIHSQPSWVFVSADGTRDRFSFRLGPAKLLERVEELAST